MGAERKDNDGAPSTLLPVHSDATKTLQHAQWGKVTGKQVTFTFISSYTESSFSSLCAPWPKLQLTWHSKRCKWPGQHLIKCYWHSDQTWKIQLSFSGPPQLPTKTCWVESVRKVLCNKPQTFKIHFNLIKYQLHVFALKHMQPHYCTKLK